MLNQDFHDPDPAFSLGSFGGLATRVSYEGTLQPCASPVLPGITAGSINLTGPVNNGDSLDYPFGGAISWSNGQRSEVAARVYGGAGQTKPIDLRVLNGPGAGKQMRMIIEASYPNSSNQRNAGPFLFPVISALFE
ncbi:hypothetical protein [Nocardia sp. NPDC127526]|uniref:hypothetical protein n=1 Tax=Nocardia sp. NPDC127526 TaxID=3345393 RepID=UPI0036411E6C